MTRFSRLVLVNSLILISALGLLSWRAEIESRRQVGQHLGTLHAELRALRGDVRSAAFQAGLASRRPARVAGMSDVTARLSAIEDYAAHLTRALAESRAAAPVAAPRAAAPASAPHTAPRQVCHFGAAPVEPEKTYRPLLYQPRQPLRNALRWLSGSDARWHARQLGRTP